MGGRAFSAVCDLLESNSKNFECVKPILKLTVKVLVTTQLDGFIAGAKLLESLGNFTSVSDVLDLFEETLAPISAWPWKKKADIGTPYENARLANSLLVFAAYFDTIERENRWLWDVLKLDKQTTDWLTEKAVDEHGGYEDALGNSNYVLRLQSNQLDALLSFYILLNRRLQQFSSGLAETEHLRADWQEYPRWALEAYKKDLQSLHAKYDLFRHWADRMLLENISEGIKDLKEENKVIISGISNKCTTPKTSLLHLPLRTSLDKKIFQGRQGDLAKITRAVAERQKPITLWGFGGMGKTELAIRYGQEHRGNVYYVTFSGTFRDTIIGPIAEGVEGLLEQKLSAEDLYQATLSRLKQCGRDDLLIVDNMDSATSTIEQLKDEAYDALCKLPMHLLITTRFEPDDEGEWIEVGALERVELHQLISRYVLLKVDEMDRLISAVDEHTLTVDLMGWTLKESFGGITPSILEAALTSGKLNSNDFPEVGISHNRSRRQKRIYDHLKALFDLSGMNEESKKILTYAVLLPEEGLEGVVFHSALPSNQKRELNNLIKHGWLSQSINNVLTIHPLIRTLCREELKPNGKVCGSFLSTVWNQYEQEIYESTLIRRLAALYSNATVELSSDEALWPFVAGWFWKELGQFQTALEYELVSLVRKRESVSDDLPILAAIDNILVNKDSPLDDSGMLTECIYEKTTLREYLCSTKLLSIALSYNNLGTTYSHLGNYQKGLECQFKALAIRKSLLPDNHPLIAGSYNNIGTTYGDLGMHNNALAYLQRAIYCATKYPSATNVDVAKSYINLGVVYNQTGDHKQALMHLQKAIALQDTLSVGERIDFSRACNNLGLTYCYVGDYQQALTILMQALTIQQALFPIDHPDIAVTYNNIGYTYGCMNDTHNALKYHTEALRIQIIAYPSNHPTIAASYHNIGKIYAQDGEYSKALVYERRSLEISEQSLPKEHLYVTKCHKNIQLLEQLIQQRKQGIDPPNPFAQPVNLEG